MASNTSSKASFAHENRSNMLLTQPLFPGDGGLGSLGMMPPRPPINFLRNPWMIGKSSSSGSLMYLSISGNTTSSISSVNLMTQSSISSESGVDETVGKGARVMRLLVLAVAVAVVEGTDPGGGEVNGRAEAPVEEVIGKIGMKLVSPCDRVVRANPVSEAASGVRET